MTCLFLWSALALHVQGPVLNFTWGTPKVMNQEYPLFCLVTLPNSISLLEIRKRWVNVSILFIPPGPSANPASSSYKWMTSFRVRVIPIALTPLQWACLIPGILHLLLLLPLVLHFQLPQRRWLTKLIWFSQQLCEALSQVLHNIHWNNKEAKVLKIKWNIQYWGE